MAACRMGVLAAAILIACCAPARGQTAPPACTAAPAPPGGVKTKVDDAFTTESTKAFTPAVLTLSWTLPNVDRNHPGNIPSAFAIEAGSDRGLSDVGIAQTAGTELTFVTPMANGTYYVRVRSVNACGQSETSKESRVRIRNSVEKGQPNPFVILSTVHATRERLANQAYVQVKGLVRNGWLGAPAPFVAVRASFEGSNGGLGVTGTAFVNGSSRRLQRSRIVTDTVIEPGGTGCFLIYAEFPAGQVTGLGLIASADRFETQPLAGRVEMDGGMSMKADQFDGLLVSGRLKNSGQVATRLNELWVEARDGAGQVLDCHGTSAHGADVTLGDGLTTRTGLAPAASGAFENATEAVFSMTHLLRQWITWDEADGATMPMVTPQYTALKKKLIELLDGDPQATSPQEIAQAREALRAEARAIEQRLTTSAGQ